MPTDSSTRLDTLANFKDHVATRQVTEGQFPVETIHWQKPGSSFYAMTFMLNQNTGHLSVTGDLGDAVYAFYRRSRLTDIAASDPHYFAGKCTASEYGRFFKHWDSDAFEAGVREYVSTEIADLPEDATELIEQYNNLRDALLSNSMSEMEAYTALTRIQLGELGSTLPYKRPLSTETLSTILSHGKITDNRCEMHLLGLQAALKQLGLLK